MPPEVEQLLSLRWGYWFLQTLAMMVTALLIPKLRITSIFGAFFAVVAIAFINSKVWDAALFFYIPDEFTLQAGLLLLTNGVIFWVAVKLLPGIEVSGVLAAILAPVIFTLSSILISRYGSHIDWLLILDHIIDRMITLRDYFQEYQSQSPSAVPVPEVQPTPNG